MSARSIFHGLLDLLAPPQCAACDVTLAPDAADFCEACEPLLEPAERAASGHAAYVYGGPMADAIRRFKYGGRSELAASLGARLAAAALPFAGEVDAVVSVPLHPRRLRERGFDQAALLARPVARALAVPLRAGVMRRARDTPPQASLERAARGRNVRGAFRVFASAGRRVLLIDDVRTTGATLTECAETLRDAGAERVHTLVLARAEIGGGSDP